MSQDSSPQRITAQLRGSIGEHEGLRDVVETLDPDDVLASQAPTLWVEFDRMERLAAAAKILLARRVDDSRVWEREGHRSAADYLAAKSGTSKAASRGVLGASKKITKLPATGAALRRGELSTAQAESIADAASHNRDAEEHLLERARTSSLGELRDECARKKAAADPDPDATYRRINENRFCRQRRDPEGAWYLTARGTPDAGAAFNAALGPIIDEIFHIAWAQGRRAAREQYAFDALIELAHRARTAHTAATTPRRPTAARPTPAGPPIPRQPATATATPQPEQTRLRPTRPRPPATTTSSPRWTTRTDRGRGAPRSDTGGDAVERTVPRIWPCCASTSPPYNAVTPKATRSARSQASGPYPSTEPANSSATRSSSSSPHEANKSPTSPTTAASPLPRNARPCYGHSPPAASPVAITASCKSTTATTGTRPTARD
jgi:hypothetical protein